MGHLRVLLNADEADTLDIVQAMEELLARIEALETAVQALQSTSNP